MTDQKPTPTSIRLTPELRSEIDKRGPATDTIRECLDRYFTILARGRRALQGKFSSEEICLIVDSCNGTIFQAWSAPLLFAGVEDSISLDGLDRKWKVDGPALVSKLKALPDSETLALVDAIEQFWEDPTDKEPGSVLAIL